MCPCLRPNLRVGLQLNVMSTVEQAVAFGLAIHGHSCMPGPLTVERLLHVYFTNRIMQSFVKSSYTKGCWVG